MHDLKIAASPWLTDRPALMIYEEYPAWKQARHQEATARTLRYVVPVVLVCILTGIIALGSERRKQRQA